MFVAIESGHPKACLLPDVYHIYKGGSDFAGLGLLSGSAIQVFHVNDYPADPPRETINDATPRLSWRRRGTAHRHLSHDSPGRLPGCALAGTV